MSPGRIAIFMHLVVEAVAIGVSVNLIHGIFCGIVGLFIVISYGESPIKFVGLFGILCRLL